MTWGGRKSSSTTAIFVSSKQRLLAVTGASAGIGLAVAQAAIDADWSVIGLDRSDTPFAHARYAHVLCDLSAPAELARVAERIGEADAFVHCAGFMRVGQVGSLDPNDGLAMWNVHVHAATVLVNALVSRWNAHQFGRAVFIGSRVSQGQAQRGQYAAAKAALVALARCWAAELAANGTTVNVVSPAATQTAMLSHPDRSASAPKLPPIGRYIAPAEVASLVVYLLSDAAAAITGQEIFVCGGSSLST
jgi:3-oxoacyl-[acyl-carrier protein] reductase